MAGFTHFHVHTQYSMLDGASKIPDLISKTKALGMEAIAITDHGNMYGVAQFLQEAKKQGVKPIIGCEVYVARRGMEKKEQKEDRSGFHLILLAKNKNGYHNLSKIVSYGYLEGFYYTPRIDKEVLKRYSDDLIASSACLGGEVSKAILNQGEAYAKEVIEEYKEIFGEDFYLELMDHGMEDQKTVNASLIKLSKETGVKMIATNDVHFINAGDAEAHHILICINTGKDATEVEGMHYTGEEYLKSPEEMAALFAEVPEAIQNTVDLTEKIECYDISRNVILPTFPLPDGFDTADEYLHHLTDEGAKKKYNPLTDEIKQRLTFELTVIKEMGYAGYFLIVQDFIAKAKELGVLVGPGRGSVAGSAVAYVIGITQIDPIRYNLLFERFLNPERVSMPDMDIDFDDYGREKVIEYVINKYGADKVAQIVTFGTMAAKSSIRDVARVMNISLSEADRLAKLVPDTPGVSLKAAFKQVPELSKAYFEGPEPINKMLRFAETLEGSTRHTGTHACGVIIGPEALIEHIPLSVQRDADMPVTQYEGKLVESVGMLKMDFLGLKTLSIIKDTIELVKDRHTISIVVEDIPFDDEKTFALFQQGHTVGTFQFESDGMRKHLRELQPTCIEDLIAMNALYRPGPMQFIPLFIDRKHQRQKVEYPHPLLEEILKPTYGIMVYQEQIMQAAQILAGYTLAGADILRRAMGKKNDEIMLQQKAEFVDGAVKNGIDKENAEQVFATMREFAKYGFNRSHSTAYSVIAYQTAYLKAHYPAEYMAAVLTHNINDIKKITFYIDAAKRSKLSVQGPNVNQSAIRFSVNDTGEILFGLGAIKGVGEAAAEAIISEREANGPFISVFDFVKRVNLRAVNKRCFESLALSGALDCFENTHRAQFFTKDNNQMTYIEKLIKFGATFQNERDNMQQSLFGDTAELSVADPELPFCEPWSRHEQLKHEKEVIGFYISGHPLEQYNVEIESFCNISLERLHEELHILEGREVKFAGIVTDAAHRMTKKGNPFGTFTIEGFDGQIQLAIFAEDYLKFKHFLTPDQCLFIRGRVQKRYKSENNELEIKVLEIVLLSKVLDKYTEKITLCIHLKDIDEKGEKAWWIKKTIAEFPGKCTVKINIASDAQALTFHVPKTKVEPSSFIPQLVKAEFVDFRLN